MSGYSLLRDRQPYFHWDHVIPKQVCEDILDFSQGLEFKQARIQGHDQDHTVRQCEITWLWPQDLPDLWDRLSDLIQEWNREFWQFDLWGVLEGAQIARYHPGSHYTWHADRIPPHHPRKLSLTLQLTDPDLYQGGDLEIMMGSDTILAPRTQGTLIMFPSWVMHRVQALGQGQRYSLTMWVSGPAFR